MFYRDQILSTFLLFSYLSLIPSDRPNADVIAQQSGGNVTYSTGSGGSVSHTPSNTGGFIPVRHGQSPSPAQSQPKPTRSGPPSGVTGGILGFLYNIGRTSERDRRHADTEAALRKAERASMGNQGCIVAGNPEKGLLPPGKSPFEQDIPLTPEERRIQAAEDAERYAREKIQQEQYNQIEEHKRALIAAEKAQNLALVKPQQEPTILPESPLKGLTDDNSGNGINSTGTGIGIGVGIAAVSKLAAPVAIPVAIPVAGGAAAGSAGVAAGAITTTIVTGGSTFGGTTAGTAGTLAAGGILATAAPVVAAVGAGIVLGTTIALVHDGIFNPGIGWFPSYEQRQAYHANRAALKAGKAPSSIPQYTPKGDTPTPSNMPNPKKPEDEKERRAQQIREHRRWTNKEAREKVKELGKGYVEKKNPPSSIKGIGFTNGKEWISPDIDGHNGGVWKLFDLKGERVGTLDKNLNRIKY